MPAAARPVSTRLRWRRPTCPRAARCHLRRMRCRLLTWWLPSRPGRALLPSQPVVAAQRGAGAPSAMAKPVEEHRPKSSSVFLKYTAAAAPPLSLTLKTWCFPVAGCVGYRGYFDEAAARRLLAALAEGRAVL